MKSTVFEHWISLFETENNTSEPRIHDCTIEIFKTYMILISVVDFPYRIGYKSFEDNFKTFFKSNPYADYHKVLAAVLYNAISKYVFFRNYSLKVVVFVHSLIQT